MDFSLFVNEYTVFSITCSECGADVGDQHCAEDAIASAENNGFVVVGDDVFCDECFTNRE